MCFPLHQQLSILFTVFWRIPRMNIACTSVNIGRLLAAIPARTRATQRSPTKGPRARWSMISPLAVALTVSLAATAVLILIAFPVLTAAWHPVVVVTTTRTHPVILQSQRKSTPRSLEGKEGRRIGMGPPQRRTSGTGIWNKIPIKKAIPITLMMDTVDLYPNVEWTSASLPQSYLGRVRK